MNENPKSPFKVVLQKWVQRGLFVVAALATLVALFYAEEDWRGRRAWEKCVAESKAKGTDLDWDHWIPAPVPDDQNFAALPIFKPLFDYKYGADGRVQWADTNEEARWGIFTMSVANEYTPELGAWTQGVSVKLTEWQNYFRGSNAPKKQSARNVESVQWPKTDVPQGAAADVLLALSRFDAKIDQLRQGSARPYSRFPVHYDELPKALLAHEVVLLQACHILQLRAIAELELGRNAAALADLRLAFYCADANRLEPFAISILVRGRAVKETLQPVWEGLREHRWSEANIKEIESMLAKIDLLAGYELALKAEPAGMAAWILATADQPDLYAVGWQKGRTDYALPDFALSALPRGWYFQNAATCARFFEALEPDVNASAGEAFPKRAEANSTLLNSLPPRLFNIIFKQEGGIFSPQDVVEGQTDVNLAKVACDLERWRLAHGRYPESLDSLIPDLASNVPRDIIGGAPLKYHVKQDGNFILYSIGWNERDDGGTPSKPTHPSGEAYFQYRPEDGDWVWQYPGKN